MDPRYALVLVLVLCSSLNAEASRDVRESCSSEYTQFSNEHNMCLTDSPHARVLTPSSNAKASIVDLHNSYRSSVAEPAANMQKMYYNEDLAKLAEKWAMQCTVHHNTYAQRSLANYTGYIGQSMFAAREKMESDDAFSTAPEAWYSEMNYFNFSDPENLYGGHYAQEIQDVSSLVGCGGAHCNDVDRDITGTIIVCNYHLAAGGAVYKKGASCSDCPNHCVNGTLCDCQGTVCMNGGTLNVGTCSCDCPRGFGGKTCSEATLCIGVKCKRAGTINYDDCSCTCLKGYSGPRCEWCPRPSLMWKSRCIAPGTCTHPTYSRTWLLESCPNCNPDCQECQTMVCLNGGTFNLKTCSCDCAVGYGGKTCAEALCSHVKCKSLGTVNYKDCSCNCVLGFEGPRCEICPEMTPDTAIWCKAPRRCTTNTWPRTYLYKLCPNCSPDCGLAEVESCGSKECLNMGTMNARTCTCNCLKGYSGDTCQNCPGPSPRYRFFCRKPGQCNKNHNRKWMYENCPNCSPNCPRY